MRYTPEQYRNMVEDVCSLIDEAEHHSWRIVQRLDGDTEDEKSSKRFFQDLCIKLNEIRATLTSLEDRLENAGNP